MNWIRRSYLHTITKAKNGKKMNKIKNQLTLCSKTMQDNEIFKKIIDKFQLIRLMYTSYIYIKD